MKKTLLALSLCLGFVAHSNAAEVLSGDAAAGEAKAGTCMACHGADGNSLVGQFPKLAGQGEKYLLKQMKDIRDGARYVPTMAGQVDNMSDQDLADIAAYYAGQTITGARTKADLAELGEQIYRGGISERNVAACAACHSPRGLGNAPAGFPRLAGQHPEYIKAQLEAYRLGYDDPAGRTNGGETMIMRSNAFPLSDLEIEAVSSYAAGLR